MAPPLSYSWGRGAVHLPIKTLYMKDSAMRCLIALALIPMFAVAAASHLRRADRPDNRATPASEQLGPRLASRRKSHPLPPSRMLRRAARSRLLGKRSRKSSRQPREWYHGVRQRKQTERRRGDHRAMPQMQQSRGKPPPGPDKADENPLRGHQERLSMTDQAGVQMKTLPDSVP